MSGVIPADRLESRTLGNEPQLSSYLQEIIDIKVRDRALTCIQCFVHWFLTTFSCFHPTYNRLYQEAEVARINSGQRENRPSGGDVADTEISEGEMQEGSAPGDDVVAIEVISDAETPAETPPAPSQEILQEIVEAQPVVEPPKTARDLCLEGVQRDGLALEGAVFEFRDDPEIVLAAAQQNIEALAFASARLKQDGYFMLSVIAQNVQAFRFAPATLREEENFLVSAVVQTPEVSRLIDSRFQENEDFWLKVLRKNAKVYRLIPRQFVERENFTLKALEQNARVYRFLNSAVQRDSAFALRAIKHNHWVFKVFREELRFVVYRRFLFDAIAQNARVFECIRDRSEGFMLDAIGQNAKVFSLIVDRSPDFVLKAIERNAQVFEIFCGEQREVHREFVLAAAARNGMILKYAVRFAKDREVVRTAVSRDALALEHAKDFQEDEEIVRIAIENNGYAYEFAGEGLRGTMAFAMIAVASCSQAIDYASGDLQSNPDLQALARATKAREDRDRESSLPELLRRCDASREEEAPY